MLNGHTLFVVGAGASCEVGMPSGYELKNQIALVLEKFPHSAERVTGLLELAIEEIAITGGKQPAALLAKARGIGRALAQAPSIDAYIESQRHDPDIAELGKLAIAACLLDYEHKSSLFHSTALHRSLDHKSLTEKTWLGKLFQILVDGRGKSDLQRLFEHSSFIVFNYDRCFQQYMRFAIENYFPDLERGQAAQIVRNCRIIHPYGSLGFLSELGDAPYGIDSKIGIEGLKNAASKLRTYSEYVEDEEALAEARKSFASVQTVVFLGFGFLPQNVRLLRKMLPKLRGEALATVYGMAEPTYRVIKADIAAIEHRPASMVSPTFANLTCCQFLEDYKLLLMSRSPREASGQEKMS